MRIGRRTIVGCGPVHNLRRSSHVASATGVDQRPGDEYQQRHDDEAPLGDRGNGSLALIRDTILVVDLASLAGDVDGVVVSVLQRRKDWWTNTLVLMDYRCLCYPK